MDFLLRKDARLRRREEEFRNDEVTETPQRVADVVEEVLLIRDAVEVSATPTEESDDGDASDARRSD